MYIYRGLVEKISSFSINRSEYASIFFMDLIPKSDKNPDLMVKKARAFQPLDRNMLAFFFYGSHSKK